MASFYGGTPGTSFIIRRYVSTPPTSAAEANEWGVKYGEHILVYDVTNRFYEHNGELWYWNGIEWDFKGNISGNPGVISEISLTDNDDIFGPDEVITLLSDSGKDLKCKLHNEIDYANATAKTWIKVDVPQTDFTFVPSMGNQGEEIEVRPINDESGAFHKTYSLKIPTPEFIVTNRNDESDKRSYLMGEILYRIPGVEGNITYEGNTYFKAGFSMPNEKSGLIVNKIIDFSEYNFIIKNAEESEKLSTDSELTYDAIQSVHTNVNSEEYQSEFSRGLENGQLLMINDTISYTKEGVTVIKPISIGYIWWGPRGQEKFYYSGTLTEATNAIRNPHGIGKEDDPAIGSTDIFFIVDED